MLTEVFTLLDLGLMLSYGHGEKESPPTWTIWSSKGLGVLKIFKSNLKYFKTQIPHCHYLLNKNQSQNEKLLINLKVITSLVPHIIVGEFWLTLF